MDVATEAYKYLSELPLIREFADEGLIGSDFTYPVWLFRDQHGVPQREVRDSGLGAIVVSQQGYWAIRNMHNTAQFPALRITIWADEKRDEVGRVTDQSAVDKCYEIYGRLDTHLHDPGKQIMKMGNMRVHDIAAGGVFTVQEVPDSDGTVFGTILYNLTTD